MYDCICYRVRFFGPPGLERTPRKAFALTTMLIIMSSSICLATILKMSLTVAAWTPEMWLVVITGGIAAVASLVNAFSGALQAFFSNKTNNEIKKAQALAQIQREADSLERKEVARGVAAEVKATAAEVKAEVALAVAKTTEAHADIAAKIVDNTKVNEEAISAANQHNQKIASLQEQVAQTVAMVAQAPTHVIVDNPDNQSIPTHQSK